MKTVLSGKTKTRPEPARRCRRLVTAGLLGTTFLVGAATSVALAAVADEDMVDVTGLTAVADESLDKLRGGFSIGPFNVNFGLIIRTAINNQQVLMTSFKVETLGKIEDIKHEYFDSWQNYLRVDTPEGSSGTSQSTQNGTTHVPNPGAGAASGSGVPDLADTIPPVENLGDTLPPVGETIKETVTAAAGGQGSPGNGQGTPAPAANVANNTGAAVGNLTLTQIENGVLLDNGNGTAILHQINSGLVSEIINVANGVNVTNAAEMNVFVSNFTDVIGRHSLFQATSSMALELARTNPLLGN